MVKAPRLFFLPALLMLSQFDLEDQFSHKIEWKNFEELPHILVFAGKHASKEAQSWGVFLHENFNNRLSPGKDHLTSMQPEEKIKVVAVASLPEVPGIFKGLFRSGFRKESPSMPLVLDFSKRLSSTFDYDSDEKNPLLVFLKNGKFSLPIGDSKEVDVPVLIRGIVSDGETQKQVLEAGKALLSSSRGSDSKNTPKAP